MPTHCIPYRETGYFSSLIEDYLEEKEALKSLYNRFPTLENFAKQMEEKGNSYPKEQRKILVEALQNQYTNLTVSEATQNHISILKEQNTFTITTGHQLNLFTGPLYFLYKIISTINLCKELKQKYPKNNFVPIYWMATEDHDFEEINYFNFNEKKVVWNRKSSGAVGELTTEGLKEVGAIFSESLGHSPNAIYLKSLFEKAYIYHNNLADATRYLANELFGKDGLVILDANKKELKQFFIPFVKKELEEQSSSLTIEETNKKIASIPNTKYKLQVNPREINLFYLRNNTRERIIKREDTYFINHSTLTFSSEEIQNEAEKHPERFSPNVMLRPLYQEVILPNLCYIGGGGEIAYWLQLKSFFEEVKITFPILLLRNSAILISKKQFEKIKKLKLSIKDFFLPTFELETKVTKQISEINIDFSPQKMYLQQQFKDLYQLAKQTDPSFIGAVAAQEKKQLNGLDALEKRLLKAQKRKISSHLNRVLTLQEELFPNRSLQERIENFSKWYLEYGEELIPMLFANLKPMEQKFKIIVL